MSVALATPLITPVSLSVASRTRPSLRSLVCLYPAELLLDRTDGELPRPFDVASRTIGANQFPAACPWPGMTNGLKQIVDDFADLVDTRDEWEARVFVKRRHHVLQCKMSIKAIQQQRDENL